MSTSINAQAAAAMARVQAHINRCAAQQARRMKDGWARTAPATPATPTPPAPLPPPGQRGSVVMFTHPADADADADTGPALAGAWAREVTAAGLALAVVTVGTLGLSAGLAWAISAHF